MSNKNKINWQIGCSGFHYKEWKEIFYPEKLPQRLWFEHYAKHFNTLELNVSFYQFPRLGTLQNWYNKSPDDFSFSLKVPRIITHYKKFTETEQLIADFYGVIKEGLVNKLGAVLFQLPPQLHYSEELLQQIIKSVHPGYNNVIEFRHNSWWKEEVYRQLAANKISFCGISHPRLPDNTVINTDTVYYRFHGVPVLYKSQYENAFVQEIADDINSNKAVKTAFIYFNNTWGPGALNNALWLKNYCGEFAKQGRAI
jgi:uncharacterized protein YecE (DUF72 family)